MKRNTNRAEFKHSILLSLGHPYINVNLSDEHLDLCINNALKAFWKWHPNGVSESQYIYQLTDTDVTNGYIPCPVWIDSVIECLPQSFALNDMNFATVEYQMARGMFMSVNQFRAISLVDYVCMKESLYNFRQVLEGPAVFTFDRYRRRITPKFSLKSGDFLVFKVYENVDPEKDDDINAINAPNVWDDECLKDFAVAEAKMLWGTVISKFGGIQLPGGVTLDGNRLIIEGNDLKEKTIDYLRNMPIDFFMG